MSFVGKRAEHIFLEN